jgi:hypothetical protein
MVKFEPSSSILINGSDQKKSGSTHSPRYKKIIHASILAMKMVNPTRQNISPFPITHDSYRLFSNISGGD